MFTFLDSHILPGDNGDIALAWKRVMAGTASLIIATPGATYYAKTPIEVTRRVVFVSWLAVFYCWLEGVVVTKTGAMSVFAGVELKSNNRAAMAHGWRFDARAWLVLCAASNFGGDGFHVEADLPYYGTNANSGCLIGCLSDGHTGRGFSWRGGDANQWLALMCTSSSCAGAWYLDGVLQSERVAAFHDQSFLGCILIACHSGVAAKTAGADPLGYCTDGDSGYGVVAFSYQESGPLLKIRHANAGLWNLGGYTADSDGFTAVGRRFSGGLEYSRNDAIDARLTMGKPVAGAIGEIKAKADAYGYALLREGGQAQTWALRRANAEPQSVVKLRTDVAGIEFPLGASFGYSNAARKITCSLVTPTAPGTVGDVVLAATPTTTLDGWRYVTSPNGSYWRAFVWGAGA